jgi:hypothetical protein
LVLGNGQPARFWAVGSDVYRKTPEEMENHAKFLAALGVNMVRLHTQIWPKDGKSPMEAVDEKELDGIFHMVAALKKQGIYVTLSPFWAMHLLEKAPVSWGLEGYTDQGKTSPWGLIFFNEKLQKAYKSWARELYTRPNPYTGISLAQDPAVAVIQVQNEDSLLFWTSQEIAPPQKKILAWKFGAWLKGKYGSLEEAKKAWSGVKHPEDDWSGGTPGLFGIWEMTQPQSGGKAVRVADQLRFFAELQRGFYAEIAAYYKNTLGCKQLINATNWRSADPVLLDDAEHWTYTSADVMAQNRYYDGIHVGPNNGWRIDPGDDMTDDSALLHPESIPTNLKQVWGHPYLITESTWVSPLGYQTEGPLLIAAYESLTGVDGYYWFSATDAQWDLDPRFPWAEVKGQKPIFKWSCSTPSLMGQFPAAALLYRLGLVKRGNPVVMEERSLEDLWQRKVPLISEAGAYDPNRDPGAFAPSSSLKQEVDRLAFLVGPVFVKLGGDPSKSQVLELDKFIDRKRKTVKSDTGEIDLDYGKGLCRVDAPGAQGATGFFKNAGGVAKLSDVTLRCSNDYATVLLVAMDGLPLRKSKRILLQAGTVTRLTGWRTRPSEFEADKRKIQGEKIVNVGTSPWRIKNISLSVALRNSVIHQATLLDVDGRPQKELKAVKREGVFNLTLPPNAIYVILE